MNSFIAEMKPPKSLCEPHRHENGMNLLNRRALNGTLACWLFFSFTFIDSFLIPSTVMDFCSKNSFRNEPIYHWYIYQLKLLHSVFVMHNHVRIPQHFLNKILFVCLFAVCYKNAQFLAFKLKRVMISKDSWSSLNRHTRLCCIFIFICQCFSISTKWNRIVKRTQKAAAHFYHFSVCLRWQFLGQVII